MHVSMKPFTFLVEVGFLSFRDNHFSLQILEHSVLKNSIQEKKQLLLRKNRQQRKYFDCDLEGQMQFVVLDVLENEMINNCYYLTFLLAASRC